MPLIGCQHHPHFIGEKTEAQARMCLTPQSLGAEPESRQVAETELLPITPPHSPEDASVEASCCIVFSYFHVSLCSPRERLLKTKERLNPVPSVSSTPAQFGHLIQYTNVCWMNEMKNQWIIVREVPRPRLRACARGGLEIVSANWRCVWACFLSLRKKQNPWKGRKKMGRNKDSGLDSMTSPLSWVSGLVNKGSCDRGPGWPLGRVGEAGKAACLNAGLHPSFSPGASAFSRYLIQGKTRTGNHVAMETREALPDTGENKHVLVGLNPHEARVVSPPSLRGPGFP